jgi:hypothetical protein
MFSPLGAILGADTVYVNNYMANIALNSKDAAVSGIH